MGKISAIFIFEMIGRPKDYLMDTFNKLLEKIAQEEGIEMKDKRVNEPKLIEDSKAGLFSTFAEAEMDFSDMNNLMRIVFGYMPSHIEVITPTEMSIKNFEFNNLLNDIALKIHSYDEAAKGLIVEKGILQRQLEEKNKTLDTKEMTEKPQAIEEKKPKAKKRNTVKS